MQTGYPPSAVPGPLPQPPCALALPGGALLVGIRHNVHDEPDADWLRRHALHRGIAAVVAAGLTFDLLVRTRELPAVSALVNQFPEARFVLDHMAKPPIASGFSNAWQNAFEELARHNNVWCKISGLVTEADPKVSKPADFDHYSQLALSAFSPKRIMFGSDLPVCTVAASYGAVKAIASRLIGSYPELADRFFRLNAIEAYHLR